MIDKIVRGLALAAFMASAAWLLNGGGFPALISFFTSGSVLVRMFMMPKHSENLKDS